MDIFNLSIINGPGGYLTASILEGFLLVYLMPSMKDEHYFGRMLFNIYFFSFKEAILEEQEKKKSKNLYVCKIGGISKALLQCRQQGYCDCFMPVKAM